MKRTVAPSARKKILNVCILLVACAVASLARAQGRASAEQGSLTLSQLIELVQIPAPDTLVARQIAERGIDFEVDDLLLQEFQNMGAGPRTMDSLRKSLLEKQGAESVAEWMERAEQQWQNGDFSTAMQYAQQVLAVDPANQRARKIAGVYSLKAHDWDRAASYAQHVISSGESLEVDVQHRHDMFVSVSLCKGKLALSKGEMSFRSLNNKDHNFTLPLSEMEEFNINQDKAAVHTRITKLEKGKPKKQNFDFMSPDATYQKSGDTLYLECPRCDSFLNFLHSLLESAVAGTQAQ